MRNKIVEAAKNTTENSSELQSNHHTNKEAIANQSSKLVKDSLIVTGGRNSSSNIDDPFDELSTMFDDLTRFMKYIMEDRPLNSL